jgi:multiple sugar transport system substrate-binding protein
MRKFSVLCASLLITVGVVSCQTGGSQSGSQGSQGTELQVWWSEGYYPEEAEAIRSTVQRWEEATNQEVNLVFYSEKDLIQQLENTVATGGAPDVFYGNGTDLVLIPRLAWEGKLADVTSVIEPVADLYFPEALESVNYSNDVAKTRSYYAVPISQLTTHMHYWKDLLEEAGEDSDNIPTDWSAFWQLWEVGQQNLRDQGLEEIYGIGLPMSAAATDTFVLFEQFLEAYNVELLDPSGALQVDDLSVRQGVIEALTEYTRFYKQGYVPPNAVEWGDPDNNVTFLSNLTLMTSNATLSIPGSQRLDEINYFERMRTVPWPNKPDGSPMRYVTSVKQIGILADSPRLEAAKELVSYIIQPDNLASYVEGSQGRFFPVMPELAQRDFWVDESDPHISVVLKQFENTRPSYTTYNPAYSTVQARNIWGEAIYSVVTADITPDAAADLAIEEIKKIFADWK